VPTGSRTPVGLRRLAQSAVHQHGPACLVGALLQGWPAASVTLPYGKRRHSRRARCRGMMRPH
jgi:hypothetical protein